MNTNAFVITIPWNHHGSDGQAPEGFAKTQSHTDANVFLRSNRRGYETTCTFIVAGKLNFCITTSSPIHDFYLRTVTVYAIRAFIEVRMCTLLAGEDVLGDLRVHTRQPACRRKMYGFNFRVQIRVLTS